MNIQYSYHNKSAIVTDEKGNSRVIPLWNNIDDILEDENIIEILNSIIGNIEFERKSEKNMDILFKIAQIASVPVYLVLMTIMSASLEQVVFKDIESFLNYLDSISVILITGVIALPVPIVGIATYLRYLNSKEEKTRQIQLDLLRKHRDSVKEHLEQLKEQSEVVESDEFDYDMLDVDVTKNILQDYSRIYEDCARNGKRYYRYYNKHGVLPRSVTKRYNEKGLEEIEQLLREKGPLLTQRKPKNA